MPVSKWSRQLSYKITIENSGAFSNFFSQEVGRDHSRGKKKKNMSKHENDAPCLLEQVLFADTFAITALWGGLWQLFESCAFSFLVQVAKN